MVIQLLGASAMTMEQLVLLGKALGQDHSVELDVGAVNCVEGRGTHFKTA